MTALDAAASGRDAGDPREAFAEQLVTGTTVGFEMLSVWLGLRLGLYEACDAGPATSAELAHRAGVDERYVREWVEHQAVAGILTVDDSLAGPDGRRYGLSAAHREVLLDETSPFHAGSMAMALASIGTVLPGLLEAYRTGAGVDFADYGDELRDHIAGMNRPMFDNDLARRWIPAVPGLRDRLAASPPAHVLDVACGSGWSSVCVARAFPMVRVDGVDADAASIQRARQHAADSGVADRVTFYARDAAELGLDESYDAALMFEALHDVARPVAALSAIRERLADGGVLLVGDMRTEERFTAPGTVLERMFYGFSVFHCLPAGRTQDGSAATGTVMRPGTVREYAHAAGFGTVQVLDVDNDFWRFYVLSA